MPRGLGLGLDLYKAGGAAAVSALAGYAANSVEPQTVFDPVNGVYAKAGATQTNFDDVVTYTGTTLRTMVNSSGNLAWAPHNRVKYSEQFDNAVWVKRGSTTVTANDTTDPDGGATADLIEGVGSAGVNDIYTVSGVNIPTGVSCTPGVYIKRVSTSGTLSIANANGSANGLWTVDMSQLPDAWLLLTSGHAAVTETNAWVGGCPGPHFYSTDATLDFHLWGAHLYRSDLGGMVDNPKRGDSYVPTTTAAVYMPALNNYVYNGSTWDDKGTLIESAAATNLLTYSEDFTDASWPKNNTATLAVDATGPDGATSAVTLVDDAAGGTNVVRVKTTSITVSTSTAYTASIYAKADQLSWLNITTVNFTTPGDVNTFFNLSSCSIGTVGSGITANIEDCGNGWCRCSITFTTDASDTTGEIFFQVAEADLDHIVDRDGTSSILIYGAQFETGSVPSSYIPTSGSTVTRAAETLTIPAANMPSYTTAVSLAMKGLMTYADNNSASEMQHYFWDSAPSYFRSYLSTAGAATGKVDLWQNDGTTLDIVSSSTTAYAPGINVAFNFAGRHTSSAVNVATDGTAVTENGTPTAVPDLSAIDCKLAYKGQFVISHFVGFAEDIGDTGIATASGAGYPA